MPSLQSEFSAKRFPFVQRVKKAPSLRELIAVHRQFRFRQTLAGNIGDGFLYATNPIYQNVRNEFLKRGFSFTQKDFCRYFDFPLMSLDEVLAARALPYRDNFAWILSLERKRPGVFNVGDLHQMSPNFNYLFHESAHCIAHSIFFGRQNMCRIPKTRESLLKILIGEAFANSIECLSGAFRAGTIGGYFLSANSYFKTNYQGPDFLREGIQSLGFPVVARTVLASFLYSNFLYRELTPREQTLIWEFSGAKNRESLRKIATIGFELNPKFRTSTTPLHLLKVGFDVDLNKLIQIDPLEFLQRKSQVELRAQVDTLLRVL